MTYQKRFPGFFTICLALVWIVNGLFCKVLNFVPRHEDIVARILDEEYSTILTKAIGIAELLMAIWILTGIRSKWCTWVQIVIVATMNLIEFLLAPDLLLFGRINLIVALVFIGIVWLHEYEPFAKSQNHNTAK